MKSFLLMIAIALTLTACGNPRARYSEAFLSRYCEAPTTIEMVFVPIGDASFMCCEQIDLHFLYREYFLLKYDSYEEFLFALMNQLDGIDIIQYLKVPHYSINNALQSEARRDMAAFLNKYLNPLEGVSDTYETKDEFRHLSVQIAYACFDNGFFVHPRGCYYDDGNYIVSLSTYVLPAFPLEYDEKLDLYVCPYPSKSPKYRKGEGRFIKDIYHHLGRTVQQDDIDKGDVLPLELIIDKNGRLIGVELPDSVLRGGSVWKKELIHAIELCQDWIPGQVNGENANVRMKYTIPLLEP